MTDTIKDIRSRLRLAMNGVASSSMREKGVEYKLNFGVSLPQIKEIATLYNKDTELAEALWREDVRELKILATLLHPVDTFTEGQAEMWIDEVCHQEIAEQLCRNLLQELPYAEELANKCIYQSEEYIQVVGFLLFARLCTKGRMLHDMYSDNLINQAKNVLDNGISRPQRAAVLALKRHGRQDNEHAKKILTNIEDYKTSDSAEKREFYNDIKFELDYFL